MTGRIAQPSTDAEWRAEGDFQSLASAEEVKADPTRLRKAKAAGKKVVAREQKALRAKQRVTGSKRTSSRGKKR